ncbi:hypothetical protein A6A27_25450 [Micromonospora sp. CB01531]|nr:hypothetical protein A6A27_25450 [Micromonospora sp. CB01531]
MVSLPETLRRHATRPEVSEFTAENMTSWYSAHDILGWPGELVIDETGGSRPPERLDNPRAVYNGWQAGVDPTRRQSTQIEEERRWIPSFEGFGEAPVEWAQR